LIFLFLRGNYAHPISTPYARRYPAVYCLPQDQGHSSSSQAPMLYGTDGDSRAIGFPPTSPLHTRGATFSPYACFLPRSPFITGYRPRDERLLSSNNARKQAQCPVCYKTFSKFGSIKVHMRIQTGEKPFHCRFCLKGFTQSGNLKTHERIHTGEKPYRCQNCGKRFIQSCALKKHLKTHFNRA